METLGNHNQAVNKSETPEQSPAETMIPSVPGSQARSAARRGIAAALGALTIASATPALAETPANDTSHAVSKESEQPKHEDHQKEPHHIFHVGGGVNLLHPTVGEGFMNYSFVPAPHPTKPHFTSTLHLGMGNYSMLNEGMEGKADHAYYPKYTAGLFAGAALNLGKQFELELSAGPGVVGLIHPTIEEGKFGHRTLTLRPSLTVELQGDLVIGHTKNYDYRFFTSVAYDAAFNMPHANTPEGVTSGIHHAVTLNLGVGIGCL